MALYDTVANIISDVAIELGLVAAAVSDPYASTDANIILLRALLKSEGKRMVLRNPWLQCIKEYSFTSTGATSYAMPADYVRVIDGTGWNTSDNVPMVPVSPQQWQRLQATDIGVDLAVLFRPRDMALSLWPTSTTGKTLTFEYASRYWVESNAATAPDKDAPTLATDKVKFDALLATRILKLAFLKAKGFDTEAALEDFREALSHVESAAVGGAAPTIDLTPTLPDTIDPELTPAVTGGVLGSGGLY